MFALCSLPEMKLTHVFGGPWTEIKLDAVEYYLKCYAKALTYAQLDIWYIDAFAGSGERESEREVGGVFEGKPLQIVKETLDGSAKRALKVEPPFKHLVFIEANPERCAALQTLAINHPRRNIQVISGDANTALISLVNERPWSLKGKSPNRGVVFLDPYSLQVDWTTLQALAATKVLDVWYLFPLRDVVRQLHHEYESIGVKEPMLDRVLSPAWRDLYSLPEPEPYQQVSLFDDLAGDPEGQRRNATSLQVEEWFRKQLQKEFAFVPEPYPIFRSRGRQAWSLFLGVSNPSSAAVELAEKFSRYVSRLPH